MFLAIAYREYLKTGREGSNVVESSRQRGQTGWSAVYGHIDHVFKHHDGQVVCPWKRHFTAL